MLMAHSTLQVCMDSSDWLPQGTMSEELSTGLDSSSSPSGGTTTDCMLAAACSSRAGQPMMERRLRPPHDRNLKCPRCDSTHTKFCYYNNYSLSQPRYFCKTCRRYWTKGGTLRNIPVGGGCRKNKKSSSKKSSNNNDPQNHPMNHHQGPFITASHLRSASPGSNNPIDLHLSFPHDQVQFPSNLANLLGAQMSLGGGGGGGSGGFMESGGLIRPIDFMESKYEGLMGGGMSRGHDFMVGANNNGNDQFGLISGIGGYNTTTFGGIYSSNSPFGMSTTNDIHHDGSSGISFMDQRLLLPFDGTNDHHNHHHHHHHQSGVDVKPNPKLLSLDWHDQGCTPTTSDHHNVGKDSSFGYNGVNGSNGLSSWTGMVGGFQSPTTNSLV